MILFSEKKLDKEKHPWFATYLEAANAFRGSAIYGYADDLNDPFVKNIWKIVGFNPEDLPLLY